MPRFPRQPILPLVSASPLLTVAIRLRVVLLVLSICRLVVVCLSFTASPVRLTVLRPLCLVMVTW